MPIKPVITARTPWDLQLVHGLEGASVGSMDIPPVPEMNFGDAQEWAARGVLPPHIDAGRFSETAAGFRGSRESRYSDGLLARAARQIQLERERARAAKADGKSAEPAARPTEPARQEPPVAVADDDAATLRAIETLDEEVMMRIVAATDRYDEVRQPSIARSAGEIMVHHRLRERGINVRNDQHRAAVTRRIASATRAIAARAVRGARYMG